MVLWLAAVAITASAPDASIERPGAAVQARATARIVTGVRLSLDGSASEGAPEPRDTSITSSDGAKAPARLVEFE